MPSPPLPPRIALTDELSPGREAGLRRQARSSLLHSQQGKGDGRGWAAFANALAFFCIMLMVALLVALWNWQKASERATAAQKQAAVAATFSDGVLQDLALSREQQAKLDRERQNLVRMLGEAERLHASLRSELSSAQQKHDEVVGNSQQALAEWNKYGQTLETNLDATRAELVNSSNALEQQRSAAEQQVARTQDELERTARQANLLAQQKNAAEREKQALDQKAQGLNEENNRLDGDVNRLRGVINNEQILRNELYLRNADLCAQVTQLRSTISTLEARLRAMEKDKDHDNKSKQGGSF